MTPESFDDGAFGTSGWEHSNRQVFSHLCGVIAFLAVVEFYFQPIFMMCRMTSNDLCNILHKTKFVNHGSNAQ